MKVHLVALLLTAAVQDNDGEKMFRAMEATIDKAKSLQIAFEADVEQVGLKQAKIKGSLLMADGKLRFDMRANFDGKDERIIAISDGKTLRSVRPDGRSDDKEAPKNLYAGILTAIKRVGPATGMLIMTEGPGANQAMKPEDIFRISEFKLGKKDKVGERPAQIVEYKLSLHVDNKEVPGTVTLWLDPKSQLPLKQIVRAEVDGNRRIVITQTYSSLQLNAKIDPKQFELPKQ